MRYLIFFLAGLMLAGCTLEDEYAEKIEQRDDSEELHSLGLGPDDKLGQDFVLGCRQCIRGDLSGLEELVKTYMQSFKDRNFSPRFFYQRSPYNEVYEQCITKASTEGKASLIDPNFIITGAVPSVLISRHMYASGLLTDGANWMRRVLSLQGRKQGFETAGTLFIRRDETYAMGIKMLGEAALLGSMSARSTLMHLISTNPALRQSDEKELSATSADDLSSPPQD